MKKSKLLIVATIFLFSFLEISAQENSIERKNIMKPINDLFAGMKQSDSSKVSKTFANDVSFFTVLNGEEPTFQKGNAQNFLNSVASVKPGFLNEVITNEKIQIDDNFATVWCDYQFYLDNQFHHCGINLFLLINTSSGWKIRQITDTRRTKDCNE